MVSTRSSCVLSQRGTSQAHAGCALPRIVHASWLRADWLRLTQTTFLDQWRLCACAEPRVFLMCTRACNNNPVPSSTCVCVCVHTRSIHLICSLFRTAWKFVTESRRGSKSNFPSIIANNLINYLRFLFTWYFQVVGGYMPKQPWWRWWRVWKRWILFSTSRTKLFTAAETK